MTYAKSIKARLNSRTKNSTALLTNFQEEQENSLQARVAELEARVEQIQEEIDRLSGNIPVHIQDAIDGIGKKQRGPEKKIDDTELLLNRDNLVQWLEDHWPAIAKPLLAAKTSDEIAAALTSVAAPLEIRPSWQCGIMDHPAELLEFLRSNKFRRKPPRKTVMDALALYKSEKREQAANRFPTRLMGNAMAGVPKLKWRTSFDKCSKNPSSYRVGHNAAEFYRSIFTASYRILK